MCVYVCVACECAHALIACFVELMTRALKYGMLLPFSCTVLIVLDREDKRVEYLTKLQL